MIKIEVEKVGVPELVNEIREALINLQSLVTNLQIELAKAKKD